MKRIVMVAVFLCSLFALASPFGADAAPTVWSGSGPGTTTVVSDGTATDPLFTYDLNPAGFNTVSWDFTTVAAQTGPVTLGYEYSGLHAWYHVTAFLNATVNGVTVAPLVNAGPQNCCTSPSNGFTYTGSVTLNVNAGDAYGFRFGGGNFDANNSLRGTLKVHIANMGRPDSKGTDFWLMFTGNIEPTPPRLFITSDKNASGFVELPGMERRTPFSVAAGKETSVTLPGDVVMSQNDVVGHQAVHVTSNAEVSVYGLNTYPGFGNRPSSTDAFLGLPTDVLGTEYIVLSYPGSQGSEFGIVPTQGGTHVTIIPSSNAGARPAGVPYEVFLEYGFQTYQLWNDADLSGTVITSDKPIAVFGGHRCASVPNGHDICSHLVEEMPPVNTWGKKFFTVPLATRPNGDIFRFLAAADDTTVMVNGAPVAVLDRGQVHERNIAGQAAITANAPILVAQYADSVSSGGVIAKPFMMLVPPVEQFLAGYSVTTPVGGYDGNRINVVAPAAAVGSVMLDGSAIPAASFTAIVGSGFSGAQIGVAPGSHLLVGSQPFGVSVYGFDADDSYGYPGGQMLAPVGAATQLTLLPLTAGASLGAQHCVQATVTDQAGGPLAGVRVDFTVTGVHPAQRSVHTNVSGQAKFCYIGTHFGVDTIRANAGGLSTTATVTWEEPLPQGGLTAAPASVPADNVAFSTVTLSDAPPGHWVHLMATLAGARFVPSRGTVDGNGRFSAVVYSTTAGLATITAYDETEGEAFAAHTCVTFTPLAGQPPLPPAECPSVVIAGVKAKYPLEARYLEGLWAPNVIKVTVSWGAAGPGRVEFTLNGVPTSKPATGPRVSYEFDMGNALIAGQNSLRIVAYDAAGHASLPTNFSPFSIAAPDWLHGLQELGVIGDLVTAGSTRAGWDYTGGVKLPVAPIKVEAPGMSKGPKLEFFVRGSVRMPFTCSTPVRIGAEGGAALSWNMLGLVWGVELKGSGFAEGVVYQCEIPGLQGMVRVDIKISGQKEWTVLEVLANYAAPGAGEAVKKIVPEAILDKLGKVYLQGNGRFYWSSALTVNQQSPYLSFSGMKVGAGAGAELGYQVQTPGAKLKVSGGLFFLANFSNPNPTEDLSKTVFDNVTVRGELGCSVQVFWFENTNRWYIEWRYPPSMQSLASTGYATPAWRLIGHPAATDYAVFRAMDPAKEAFAFPAAMTSEGFASPSATTVVTSVLVSNVYTYTEPSLALHPSTGNALMLWVHDDITRPVGQAQEINFSRWNGSAWSAPAGLTSDNLLDGAPSVAWSGTGKALAVWHRLNTTLPITATWDITTAQRMEIATASYDLALNTWSPVTLLTNNSSLDMEPQLVRNAAGGLLAAWRQNDAGLVNGTEADPDRIMTAFYGTAWSAPTSAVEGIPGVNELAAGYGDGAATLAFSQFITPTGTITPVLQIFTTAWNGSAWTAPVRRTDDDLNHRHPQVAYNATNEPLLVWLADKELRLWNLATGFQSAVAVPEEIGTPDEFRLVQDAAGDLAAFFTAQAAQRDLFVMFYDQPSGLWGKPFRLSSDTLSEAYPAPAIDAAGRLLAGYTATTITGVSTTTTDPATGEVITYTVPTEGQTDLMTLSHPFVRNLTIADGDLAVSDEHPAPGSSVTISATVRNTGDRPVAGVVVGLYDGSPQQGGTLIGMRSLPGLLQGGFTQTVTVTYLLPDTGGVSTLYALADPANAIEESDESDNSANLKAFGPDLSFEDAGPEYWGGNDVGLVTVIRNRGTTASPATSLAFHRDALTGTLITANAVPPLAAGQEITLITDWNHGDLPAGDHTLAVEVNPGQADFDEAVTMNNATALKLSVQPDLVVSSQYMWAAVQPDGLVAITATVTNQGSAAAPASEVTIYAEAPFRDAGRVARLAVPALAVGGQAVVATHWAPTSPGQHTLYAVANPDRVLSELTWSNNVASTSVDADPVGQLYLPLISRGR